MLPQFIRFYGYTAQQALDEYAVRFFSLVNYMRRLEATELLNELSILSSAFAGGKEARPLVEQLKKQAKGVQGIVQEVRNVKSNQL